MRKFIYLLFMSCMALLFTACPNPTVKLLNSEKDITAFCFDSPAAIGIINGTDIAVSFPYGTNVTNIIATFTTTGMSVDLNGTAQISGTTANDFSNPCIYTVTAADGSTKDYKVTVTIAANTARELTAFEFTAAANTALTTDFTGTIIGTDIAVTLPYGTDRSALIATFTSTGDLVSQGNTVQRSGTTANDFTHPVSYTVTAADGSTQNYTVTVTLASNRAKEITSFVFSATANTALTTDFIGTFTGTEIAIILPYGTDRSALIATFTSTGDLVSQGNAVQTSGTTANDFTNPVNYIVTAADGSTQNYTVTVTLALNSAKAITSFGFTAADNTVLTTDIIGTINGTDIALTLPYGTDKSALIATFTSTGDMVSQGNAVQSSGTTANDFTNPVNYIVTAADGSTQNYTVTVTLALNSAKAITSFGFTAADNTALTMDVAGIISGTDIALTLPYVTDLSALIATFTITGDLLIRNNTPQISGTTTNDFSSPVIYTVTAQDGSTQNYTVTVSLAANTAKDITSFSFESSLNTGFGTTRTGHMNGADIRIAVPEGAFWTSLTASFTLSDQATVSVGGIIQESGVTVNDFSSPVTYTVTAGDGSTQNYTITAVKPILHASDMQENDYLGRSVSIDGDYMVVGASQEDGGNGNPTHTAGAVYVFKNDGGDIWSEVAILHASDKQNMDFFGYSVSINGNYIVVGAYGEDGGSGSPRTDGGAVYVFKNNGSNRWSEVAILHASDIQRGDYFGCSVDIDGDYIIAGAEKESGGSGDPAFLAGAAYVFKNNGSDTWTEVDILHASDIQGGDYFGCSVSIDGDYMVVGSMRNSYYTGAAYVFKNNGSDRWTEVDILYASDKQPDDYFGNSVSIDGNYVVIGALNKNGGSGNSITWAGAAYVFKRAGGDTWDEIAVIHASDMQPYDRFGFSVSIDGDYIIAGAEREAGGSGDPVAYAGAVYVYQLSDLE